MSNRHSAALARCASGAFLLLAFLANLARAGTPSPPRLLSLPARPANAPLGSECSRRLASLTLPEREAEVAAQVFAGNVPDFLRRFTPVKLTARPGSWTNEAVLHVAPDYLAIGSDSDYLYVPLSPQSARKIADRLDCSLPTTRLVDEIYAAATVQLAPNPMAPGPLMTTVQEFSNHTAIIIRQLAEQQRPPGTLVAGHKKDVVLSPRLKNGKVAIYGWHQPNGVPIQPIYTGHTASWVDYSHGIRLVHNRVLLDGAETNLSALLTNVALSDLVSNEGPVSPNLYVTPQTSAPDTTAEVPRPDEVETQLRFTPDVRIRINRPARMDFGDSCLVLYALPNGNTIEQTAGKPLEPGDDWHFDIQHIAAQTRFARRQLPDTALTVAYLEAAQRSWPAWKRQHGTSAIPAVLHAVIQALPKPPARIALCAHSGGGSWIFGFIDASDRIPDQVSRIAFLDANYGYSRNARHKAKIVEWLKRSPSNHLLVFAYDDASALLDGKPFVSAAGGTWGKSHEMLADLASEFAFVDSTNAPMRRSRALDGRVRFYLIENPDHKILHTLQVERNGFIHALLAGTARDEKDYSYFGPRAY